MHGLRLLQAARAASQNGNKRVDVANKARTLYDSTMSFAPTSSRTVKLYLEKQDPKAFGRSGSPKIKVNVMGNVAFAIAPPKAETKTDEAFLDEDASDPFADVRATGRSIKD